MAVRAAGPVSVDFAGGDVVVVGAVCALASVIVAAIITANAAVIVILDMNFLQRTFDSAQVPTSASRAGFPIDY